MKERDAFVHAWIYTHAWASTLQRRATHKWSTEYCQRGGWCRWTCDTDWAQHGVPFQPDSLGGTRGWPLITTTSCEPTNSDPPPQALPEALGFEASGQQAVVAADVDDASDELDTGDQQNDGDADEDADGDNEEDGNGDDEEDDDGDNEEDGDGDAEEDAGGDSDAEEDGGFASASGALALMRSMIVNRIKQNRG